MAEYITTDAQQDTSFNFHCALKSIYDELVQRDVSAMKFLCADVIPFQKMEKVKTALDLFSELKTRLKICPPDNVRFVAELLYCLRQNHLFKVLPYNCRDVGQSVEGGTSQLLPCRILLHRICEEITEENFKILRYLCTDISKSVMEKIRSTQDLILALEKQGLIRVANGNLSFLRKILNDTNLEELVERIDQFSNGTCTGSSINQVARSSISNNAIANLDVSTPGFSPPHAPLSECLHGARGHQNMLQPEDPFAGAVPKVCSAGHNFSDVFEGQTKIGAGLTEPNLPEGAAATVQVLHDEDALPSYRMTRHPRGICLIFNNKTFHKDENDPDSRQQKTRCGSEIDCELLANVFREKLDFRVEVYDDLNNTEICDQLATTANKDHSNFDCFVCCVLSHGTNGAIYGANGKLVQMKHMKSYFRPSGCPSLCGKPKLFFIQACQGEEKHRASDIVTDGPSVAEGRVGCGGTTPNRGTIPDEADFLVALSTVPGYVSLRSRSKGSWFITTLVKMLHELVDHCDLLSILTRVNEEISLAEDLKNDIVCKQVAMPMTTLRRQVRFHLDK